MRPALPREAATVVLLRDGPGGLESLLLQRHQRSRFAPGAFAFPGGRLEAVDSAPEAERRCRGLTASEAARILGDVAPPGRALGFWVAVLRELFEETGILLAYDAAGEPVGGELLRRRLAAYRGRCREDGRQFLTMLADQALLLATDRLAYWAHWITPEERPLRYDTRFFVAAAFPGVVAEPDGLEVVAARWLRPEAALQAAGAGALTLPFVTRAILASLAPYRAVTEVLAAARGRQVRAVRPRLVTADGVERILLPGDPGYY